MLQIRSLTRILNDAGDLEDNLSPRVPVIEIVGNQRVTVEGHKGVLEYDTAEVMFRIKSGIVRVRGNHLLIAKMTQRVLVIRGTISDVHIESRE